MRRADPTERRIDCGASRAPELERFIEAGDAALFEHTSILVIGGSAAAPDQHVTTPRPTFGRHF